VTCGHIFLVALSRHGSHLGSICSIRQFQGHHSDGWHNKAPNRGPKSSARSVLANVSGGRPKRIPVLLVINLTNCLQHPLEVGIRRRLRLETACDMDSAGPGLKSTRGGQASSSWTDRALAGHVFISHWLPGRVRVALRCRRRRAGARAAGRCTQGSDSVASERGPSPRRFGRQAARPRPGPGPGSEPEGYRRSPAALTGRARQPAAPGPGRRRSVPKHPSRPYSLSHRRRA
jgi:hypothetical protein